jgi:outer membrane protein assembly factor BamB
MRIIGYTSVLVVSAAIATLVAQGESGEITQWRGANRDGAAALTVPATWPDALVQKWKVEVGLGYATPLLSGNRLYIFSRQGENEVMSALDAATGKEIWHTGYPATFQMQSAAVRHGPGPKSTPVLFQGRLYSIGMTGIVSCIEASTGKMLWQKPGTGVMTLYTSHSFSPIIDSGRVIFFLGGNNAGALSALDLYTGEAKWQWTGDGPGYGSPMIATLGGTRQLVTFSQTKMVGVDVATGKLLWERPFVGPSVNNMITPILDGEHIIIGGTGGPTMALSVTKTGDTWTTTPVWENADLPMRMANAVVVGDTMFGLSSKNSGQYFAIDTKTGKTLWTSEGRQAPNAGAAMLKAGEFVLILDETGQLLVTRASRTAFEVVKKYKVADTETFAQPTFSGNRIFVKDVSTLTLWTLS